MKDYRLLITGTSRSGTTLLDKILDIHRDINVLSQPFPKLYRYLKQEFYQSIGIHDKYYVLDDLFLPEYYPEQFIDFLKNKKVEKVELKKILHSMEGWSGQYTKFNHNDKLTKEYIQSELHNVYKHLLNVIYNSSNSIIGTKETLIEEFVPYFLKNSIKVILIIRDPRDVYTSLNIGQGPEYGGAPRPTLFHLRNWRKSIAIANTFKDNGNFLVIRYEDLLTNHETTLKEITDFLGVYSFPPGYFDDGIKTKNGQEWKGNSSTNVHKGINPQNKGKYKKYLSENTIKYIEYICKPEMFAYNYDVEINGIDPFSFEEPFKIGDTGLNPQMSTDPAEIEREQKRIKLLTEKQPNNEDIQKMFYSKKNYEQLKVSIK